jgi:hypothetical protein
MTWLCRFIGGGSLLIATALWINDDNARALPGAVLALVWLIAGQLSAVIDQQEKGRDR